jgi:hypothetical protein
MARMILPRASKRSLVLAAAVAVACVGLSARAFAQTHTDFSGRWSLDVPAPTAPPGGGRGAPARGDMGSGWGSPITLTQTGTQLKVEFVFYGRGDMQPPIAYVFALDGSETRNSVMTGQATDVQRSKAVWDGAALVITTSQSFVDPGTAKPVPAEVTRRLTLDADALVIETTRMGVLGGPSSTVRTTYKKN